MPRFLRRLLTAALLAGLATGGRATEVESGWWARLNVRDLQGEPLQPAGRWIVLVFLSPECPVANADIPVLNALATEFAPYGISFVGAYADPNLALPVLRQHAADYHLTFTTADDREQQLVRATGAVYTPEVFVFTREGALLYRGRIDDRVVDLDTARPTATHEDLREVLTALTAGKPVPYASQRGFGCAIPKRVKS